MKPPDFLVVIQCNVRLDYDKLMTRDYLAGKTCLLPCYTTITCTASILIRFMMDCLARPVIKRLADNNFICHIITNYTTDTNNE